MARVKLSIEFQVIFQYKRLDPSLGCRDRGDFFVSPVIGLRCRSSRRMDASDGVACFGACGLNLPAGHKPARKVPRIGRMYFLHPAIRLAELEKFDA